MAADVFWYFNKGVWTFYIHCISCMHCIAWFRLTLFSSRALRMHQTNNARCVDLLWRHVLSIVLLGVALAVSYSRSARAFAPPAPLLSLPRLFVAYRFCGFQGVPAVPHVEAGVLRWRGRQRHRRGLVLHHAGAAHPVVPQNSSMVRPLRHFSLAVSQSPQYIIFFCTQFRVTCCHVRKKAHPNCGIVLYLFIYIFFTNLDKGIPT